MPRFDRKQRADDVAYMRTIRESLETVFGTRESLSLRKPMTSSSKQVSRLHLVENVKSWRNEGVVPWKINFAVSPSGGGEGRCGGQPTSKMLSSSSNTLFDGQSL